MLAVILLLIVLVVVVVVVVTVSRRGYLLIRPDQARSDCDQSGVGAFDSPKCNKRSKARRDCNEADG